MYQKFIIAPSFCDDILFIRKNSGRQANLPRSSVEIPERAIWVVPAVLVVCTSVNIHSTGLHTPSLPYLPRLLSTSTETVQLTVSLNLVAYAFAHLLYGPLSDQFDGRQFLRVGMGGLLFVRITSGVVVLIIRELFDRVTPSGSGRIMG